jgi:hypothetical protein
MTAYGVHNWNHSSKRHVTLVALDGLETRGRPQTEASSFGKAGWGPFLEPRDSSPALVQK